MWRYEKLCWLLCFLTFVMTVIIVIFNIMHSPSFSPNATTLKEVDSAADNTVSSDGDGQSKSQTDVDFIDADDSSDVDSVEIYYDLNTVTFEQLLEVPEIGEVKASAILQMRDDLGGYTSVEQLLDVSGIGEATYEKIAPYFYVG